MSKGTVFFTLIIIFLMLIRSALQESISIDKKGLLFYAPNITPVTSSALFKNQEGIPGFMHGTFASLSVTLFSELGDKTFFLAAILAMRKSRLQVFVGALAALIPMTILSVVFGMAASVVPKIVLHIVSSFLLAVFGINMLREGVGMSKDDTLQELKTCDDNLAKTDKCLALTQAFTLTLIGEWGDRSQFATILLATTEDACGVALGGVLGHTICTAAAVMGGRLAAQKMPVKNMTIIGGIVFIMFSVTTWIW